MVLEACVQTLHESVKAEKMGANQIELCDRLDLDGLTPDFDLVRNVVNTIKIPVKIMIRSRAGDFCYNDLELAKMISDIDSCKKLGIKEVTFGCLTDKNDIDILSTKKLVHAAHPMLVTFHKAIDMSNDIIEGLEILSKIKPIKSILTSGGKESAKEGQFVIRKILEHFQNRFKIFACGKVTRENLIFLHNKIGADYYHGKKIVF